MDSLRIMDLDIKACKYFLVDAMKMSTIWDV